MKLFQRRIENFTCDKCGHKVKGTGYTNHCPKCLYGKHVDINPGDRQETCQGLMKPISVEQKHGEYLITHQCVKCKAIRKNKAAPEDNYELIIEISKQP